MKRFDGFLRCAHGHRRYPRTDPRSAQVTPDTIVGKRLRGRCVPSLSLYLDVTGQAFEDLGPRPPPRAQPDLKPVPELSRFNSRP